MKNSEIYLKKLYEIELILTNKADIEEINQLKNNIEQYKDLLDYDNFSKISHTYKSLTINIFDALKQELNGTTIQNFVDENGVKEQRVSINSSNNRNTLLYAFVYQQPIFQNLNTSFKILDILSIFREERKNIVLLGANGSGKSSFADFLKKSVVNNINVLPAQKILQINLNGSYKYSADIETVREKQKDTNTKGSIDTYYSASDFAHVITAIVSSDLQLLVEKENGHISQAEYMQQSLFIKLKSIFEQLIPDITLKQNASIRLITPTKYNIEYALNELSDGEKALLYYIGNVILASADSFIIIDEPETYINPSIYKKLWDILTIDRNDCQFIFITHSMDFIASRDSINTSSYWIKSYLPPECVF